MAKKYYSAKAQAEAMALANTGSEKVQGVLKGESIYHDPNRGNLAAVSQNWEL
jgi:hypothetical protein